MKREEVLFYMTASQLYLYLVNAKKEIIDELDTSSFFMYGEIKDVQTCSEEINRILNLHKLSGYLLRPNIHVLYNDYTYCDLEFLYKNALLPFNYNEIKFYSISEILKTFKNNDKIVVFDKNYYSICKYKRKVQFIEDIDFEPVVIGADKSEHVHYNDKDIIWHIFKSSFTKA